MNAKDAIDEIEAGNASVENLSYLLSDPDPETGKALFDAAYRVKLEHSGKKVFFRALIELSNVCSKNCLYCGIRRDSESVPRYTAERDEVIAAADWADAQQYGSLVLQAGERTDPAFVDFVEDVIKEIKSRTSLGLTLSLGEQSPDVYKRWFDAGAHRYLLRIETSDPQLYAKLHPSECIYEERIACLRSLKEIGYQVGTGVMIGLPGQTTDLLAADLLFFRDIDVDMIGMGPYLFSSEALLPDSPISEAERLEVGLRMVAAARLLMRDVNIAATTALQVLDPQGRELGLKAGANVIMPNVTDIKYRTAYQLYENKPCMDENAEQCRGCLQRRIESIGETIGFGEWGDSLHFAARQGR